MDAQTQLELEAAAFRRLRQHLMVDRTDVQNIDMMNLTGFCCNCLHVSKASHRMPFPYFISIMSVGRRLYGANSGM